MRGIVWLVSYPKSGNTWFRALISNLLADRDEPVDINALRTGGISSSRDTFDEFTGLEASDLTFEEIERLRPEIYACMAEQAEQPLFIKVHDAYTYLPDGSPLFPPVKARAIYIIRNPLDVAVSYSHHAQRDLDTTIANMANAHHCFCGKKNRLHNQLRQKLLSWSGHVESWLQAEGMHVHLVRYEDMIAKPLQTFTEAVNFSGLSVSEEQIKKAIRFSDFTVLQQMETEKGFQEKPRGMAAFFREGRSGAWDDHLTPEQADNIRKAHADTMKHFGYTV